jgi:uncharacterized lipoprotein YbaY
MILRTRTEKILYSALEMKCDPQNAWMPLELALKFAERQFPKHDRSFLSSSIKHREEIVWVSHPSGRDDL